jgi:hypothetical protein
MGTPVTELDAEWIDARGRQGVGIALLCPLCRKTNLAVQFLNPLDGGPSLPPDDNVPGDNSGKRWARSGMKLEDLTVSPSIDASGVKRDWWPPGSDGDAKFTAANRPCTQGGSQHWHGSIAHGVAG